MYKYSTDFSEFLTETASSSLQLIPRIFAEQGVRGLMAVREGQRERQRKREGGREGEMCVCVCFPHFCLAGRPCSHGVACVHVWCERKSVC
jgi:hypothetical protein